MRITNTHPVETIGFLTQQAEFANQLGLRVFLDGCETLAQDPDYLIEAGPGDAFTVIVYGPTGPARFVIEQDDAFDVQVRP